MFQPSQAAGWGPETGASRRRRCVSVLTSLFALALAACAGAGSAAGTSFSGSSDTTAPPAASEPRLWIKDGAQVVPLENGRTVTVNGLAVEIYIAPYPPARRASIDFYLTRQQAPVEGGIVTLQYDMTVMEHGPFAILARATGGGHYLAPMEFPMAGDFWVNASLETGPSRSVINMFVQAGR